MRRDVAQLGRALDWGSRGRGFKSRRPDGFSNACAVCTARKYSSRWDHDRGRSLQPRRAVEELRNLRDQAATPEVRRTGPEHKSWRAKVVAVMQAALGQDSKTLAEFRKLRC